MCVCVCVCVCVCGGGGRGQGGMFRNGEIVFGMGEGALTPPQIMELMGCV